VSEQRHRSRNIIIPHYPSHPKESGHFHEVAGQTRLVFIVFLKLFPKTPAVEELVEFKSIPHS
jgi:hypothetical protein